MYYMRGMLTMNGEIITQTQNNNDLLLKKDNQKELFNRFIVFLIALSFLLMPHQTLSGPTGVH